MISPIHQSPIYEALTAYEEAYHKLWTQIQNHPDEFPQGAISPGTIAEYYVKKYLEAKYPDSEVVFGSSNEKSWDIKVKKPNDDVIFYQVKSISGFNKTRKLSRLERGFDKLIVIDMDCTFFPTQAFMFEDTSVLFGKERITALTVPKQNSNSTRKNGSNLFKYANDISEDFFNILADKL